MEPKWPRIAFFKSYGFQSLEKEGTLSPKRGKAMLPKTLQDAPDMLTRIPKTTQQPPRRTKRNKKEHQCLRPSGRVTSRQGWFFFLDMFVKSLELPENSQMILREFWK